MFGFFKNLISPLVQQTSQFTSLVLELLFIQSHLLGENLAFAHFAAAIANHHNLALSLQPGTYAVG